jgi:hypothetical protein
MLEILRRVFDFSDWQTNHPKDVPPGDMLDASFDAQDSKINEIIAYLGLIQGSDGRLKAGSVTKDALDPAVAADLAQKAMIPVENLLNQVISAKNEAQAAKTAAQDAESSVSSAKMAVEEATLELLPAKSATLARIQDLHDRAASLLAEATLLNDELVTMDEDWQTSRAEAEAWAESSRLWAEHMPNTLPDNALKIMDITGDHWSSRWWANYADNAFGRLYDLYLGVFPDPPPTNLHGGPIAIGSIYYDSSLGAFFVWTGTEWVEMGEPRPAPTIQATLIYQAGASQTVFSTLTADLAGNSWGMNAIAPEPLGVHVNGLKKIKDVPGALGDYTVDAAASTVTFLAPVPASATVIIDVYVSNAAVSPAGVNAWGLKDIDLDPVTGLPGTQNGTTTVFTLKAKNSAITVNVARSEELFVSVDGVPQEPGVAFTAVGDQLTFTTAPEVDAYVFSVWYQANPNLDLGGDKYTKTEADGRFVNTTGDTMTGPLVLSGNPTLPLHPVTKQLLDATTILYAPLAGAAFTGPVTLPDGGSAVATSLSFGAVGTGFYGQAGSFLNAAIGGIQKFILQAGGLSFGASFKLTTSPAVAATAGFRLNPGAAPTTPVDGDMWATSAGIYAQIAGATVGPMVGANLLSTYAPLAGATFTGKVKTAASTSGAAGFNLSPGVSPLSPVDGDFWCDTFVAQLRMGGTNYWLAFLNQNQTYTGAMTFNARTVFAASGTTASIQLRPGTTPASPVDGDMWLTSVGLFARVSGATVGPLLGQAALTAALAAYAPLAGATFTGKVNTPASAAGGAGLNIGAAGVGPTTPVEGDIWLANNLLSYRTSAATRSAVDNATNMNVGGIKTFTVSPVVPDLTAGDNSTKAVNSKYVDAADALNAKLAGATFAGKVATPASVAGAAGFNLPAGAAPTTPVDGDIWLSGTTLVQRIAGVNVNYVNTNYAQTIAGAKTFSGGLTTAGANVLGGSLTVSGTVTVTGSMSFSGVYPVLAAGAAGYPSMRMSAGVAPSAPTNGDMWLTATGLFIRAGGTTRNASIAVGTTAPSSPVAGDLWVDTN